MALRIRYESQREQAGQARWVSNTDGDTPTIQLTIRLLGIDAPEVHYPGTQKPSTFDTKLENLLKTHRHAFKTEEFRKYLAQRLTDRPGTRQLLWGERAQRDRRRTAGRGQAARARRLLLRGGRG